MVVTLPANVLEQMRANAGAKGALYGRLRDDGDVAQVQGIEAAAGALLGFWLRDTTPDLLPRAEGKVCVLVSDAAPAEVVAYAFTQQGWQRCDSMIVRTRNDYTARLRGLFESDALANARVAVIGLGSGGSLTAVQLARCGVGQMRLVDYDRLEVANIARHVCGLSDIGRYKTRAVRDLLLDTSPLVTVQTFEADILADDALLGQVVEGCDLVIAATDSEESKQAINRCCWPLAIPVVYGAAYNRAFGGDQFRAIPPDGPCYYCFQSAVSEFFDTPPPTQARDLGIGYADPSRMQDLVAEPGLGMDVGVIALLMARMALMTLLRKHPTTLTDLPTNWLLFGNRAEWIFQKPLESIFIDIPKLPNCPVCGYDAFVRESLGMSAEAAQAVAEQIISDAAPFELPNIGLPRDQQ